MPRMSSAEPKYTITVAMIARRLGVSKSKARQWCEQGWIAGAVNIGDRAKHFWRVTPGALEAFKRERTNLESAVVQRRRACVRAWQKPPVLNRMGI
jgi:hypothetical protein